MNSCESRIQFNPSFVHIIVLNQNNTWQKDVMKTLTKEGFNTVELSDITEVYNYFDTHEVDYLLMESKSHEFTSLIEQKNYKHVKKIIFNDSLELIDEALLLSNRIIEVIGTQYDIESKIKNLPNLLERFEKNSYKTVLVTSEDEQTLKKIELALINRNFEVLTSQSNNEVLELVHKHTIDMVLLDLELNEQTYEFFIQNRNRLIEELGVNLIVSTASHISAQFIKNTLRSGVVDILRKPLLLDELVVKIELSIENSEQAWELKCSTQLLEQYKNTVDRSSIVSKTDPKGMITYVNEAFCKISGYSEQELLGKAHNIVRHPDMDPLIFKDMWYTIKELKQPWKGKVKNRKKDGSDYWVQTIINPIINANGDVIEYIGIRTDITDVERTKEYFQKQYNITRGNFNEVMNLSKLYEDAIEQSNIILRIDTQRKITYANEMFYEISGYSKEELIGQPYNIIKRPDDVKKSFIDAMWKTIEAGKIWKGQLKNINKKGKVYHSIATVVPIKNAKGEILEYMSIRKDITPVVELHEELEATQREIVYKMGEIGETRSKETGNHVKRVAEYSQLLGKLCGLSEKECEILFTASPMHDIGKVGIPDAILHKPGKLDEKEWKIMKSHSTIGYNILKNSKREVLKAAAIVAREHHEKWNGTGYPRKLKGEDIHIFGRITALADVFDALGSDRCYKKAWKDEDIFKLIKEERAEHFDPNLVDLFFEHVDSFKAIRDKYQDKIE